MSNKTRIVRGDVDLELYPDEVIAQTLQGPNIGDLTTRGFNFTNTFKIPGKSQVNQEAYEGANKIQSETDVPYTQETIKVIQNGIEIESNGKERLVSAGKDFDVMISSGAIGFFDSVGDKMLSDLDDFVLETGDTEQTALRNSTSGILYAVSDYGDGVLVGWPSVYDLSMLNNIIEMAGYTAEGNIFSNTKFIKTVTGAFAKETGYVSSFIDKRRVSVSVITPQNIVASGGIPVNINFTGVSEGGTDPFGYWDGLDSYIINDPRISSGQAIFAATIKIIVNVTVQVGKTVDIEIPAPGLGSAIVVASGVSSGTYSFNSTGVFDMIPTKGSDISLKLIFDGTDPVNTATINFGTMIIEPVSSPIGYLFGTGGTYPGLLYDDVAGLLPDIKQRDFIKDIMINYGLIATEKNGVVTFTSYDEIIADRANALNWTTKRVPDVEQDKLTYTPYSYGQQNVFRYTNVDSLVSTNYGMGAFEIDNDNIKEVVDPFYKSIYAAARTSIYGNIISAALELLDGSGVSFPNIMNKASNRKLLVRDKYSYEPAVNYMDGSPYSDYKVLYFEDPNQSDSMRFQHYIDQNYPLFIQALQKAKFANWYYNLTETDIAGFDFLRLVFDKDTYFLVNRINNYVPGVKTLVQQFKV